MRKFFLIWLCLILAFNLVSKAQNLSTEGDDFWVCFMQNWLQDSNNPIILEIYISANDSTKGTLSIPGAGNAFPELEFSVIPKVSTVIPIPTDLAMLTLSNAIENKGIHIKTDKDVSVYAMNKRQYSADMTVVLPTYTLGNDYFIMSHWEDDNRDNNAHSDSEFAIVASEDQTEIEITPSVLTKSGNLPDVPFTITLDQGECYQVQAAAELTGTRVSAIKNSASECKRFAVFAGNKYTKVGHCDNPDGHDHLFSQMYPVKTWGKEYTSLSFLSRDGGDYIKILAAYDSTKIYINGNELQNYAGPYFNSGEYYVILIDGVNSITASKPVCVGQFSRSQACDYTRGDPFLIMLNPNQQVLQRITFFAPSIATIVNYDLSIVTKTTDVESVMLDNYPIGDLFYQVPGNAGYSFARILISQGNHTLRSKEGIIAYVYGYGSNESFGYATGAGLGNINLQVALVAPDGNPIPSDSVCQGEPFYFTIHTDQDYNNYSWDFGDGNTMISGPDDLLYYHYDEAGKFIVTLHAKTSDEGCVGAQEQSVRIVKVMNPQSAILGPRSVCPNTDHVLYRISNKYDYHYSWSAAGGVIADDITNDSIWVNWGESNPEAFVSVTTSDQRGCVGDPVNKNIKVMNRLEPDPPQGADTLCSDAITNLTYSTYTVPGTEYYWNTDNGTITADDSSENVTLDWNTYGTGKLWYFQQSVTDTICAGISDTLSVYIQRKPDEALTILTPKNSYGIGESVELSAVTDTLYNIINWNFGNGTALDSVSIDYRPDLTYRCAGSYEISALSIDTAGICVAEAWDKVGIEVYGPEMELVNITHEGFLNNRLFIHWKPPESTYTKPYYLFRADTNNIWRSMDTLFYPAMSRMDTTVKTDKVAYSYRLQTNNDCPDVVNSEIQRSILLTTSVRNNQAVIGWTGYVNWENGVKEYEIWKKLDDKPFVLLRKINDRNFKDTVRNDGFEHCYAVKAIENNGNNSYSWSNTACVTLAPELYPYNVITPNGDGMNETFVIENIEFYPNSLLTVYNRWGKKLIEFRGYNNNWSGMVNGNILPPSTYFYELELNDKRARLKYINGMISILR